MDESPTDSTPDSAALEVLGVVRELKPPGLSERRVATTLCRGFPRTAMKPQVKAQPGVSVRSRPHHHFGGRSLLGGYHPYWPTQNLRRL